MEESPSWCCDSHQSLCGLSDNLWIWHHLVLRNWRSAIVGHWRARQGFFEHLLVSLDLPEVVLADQVYVSRPWIDRSHASPLDVSGSRQLEATVSTVMVGRMVHGWTAEIGAANVPYTKSTA